MFFLITTLGAFVQYFGGRRCLLFLVVKIGTSVCLLEVDGATLPPAAHVEVVAVCRLRDAELLI